MQRVDDVIWDAAHHALLVSGNPAGDSSCCIRGLWLARPDGTGTRLDDGGTEIRGASISPDGTIMAWISPDQAGQTRVVVMDATGTRTVTRLPKVDQVLDADYFETVVGPTGRVFASMLTLYAHQRIVEIPRAGRGRVVPGQPRVRYSNDSPAAEVARSPDGRRLARCARVHGRNVAGLLNAVTGKLSSRRVGRSRLGYCGVTDGGTVVSAGSSVDRRSGRLVNTFYVLPAGRPSRHWRIRRGSAIFDGPHAMLVVRSGRRLRVLPESGQRPRRVATPRKFRVGKEPEDFAVVAWSSDGRRAAIGYTNSRATAHGCPPVNRLLVVDVRRHRTLRHLARTPGGHSIKDLRFTADGERVCSPPPARTGASLARTARGRWDRPPGLRWIWTARASPTRASGTSRVSERSSPKIGRSTTHARRRSDSSALRHRSAPGRSRRPVADAA